jgi:aryl-alcohol dehydrogenase-like predicted oxidoreductase
LSGLYRKGKPIENTPRNQGEGFRKAIEKNIDVLEALTQLAESQGKTLAQLAYAFLYHQPHVASVIVGPRTLDHLDEAIKALDYKLDEATLKKINEIVPPGTSPDYVGW